MQMVRFCIPIIPLIFIRRQQRFSHARTKKWDKLKAETTQIHYEFTGNELIAKLMMLQKTKKKTPSLPFGLYYKNDKYIVERTKGQTGDLLKFKSFSQGIR
jgi:DNA polymerase-3 subunit epsilon